MTTTGTETATAIMVTSAPPLVEGSWGVVSCAGVLDGVGGGGGAIVGNGGASCGVTGPGVTGAGVTGAGMTGPVILRILLLPESQM